MNDTPEISKTEFVFVVLHRTDEPFDEDYRSFEPGVEGTLAEALIRSYDGHAVGAVVSEITTPVQNRDVERELQALGNDGEFFLDDITADA